MDSKLMNNLDAQVSKIEKKLNKYKKINRVLMVVIIVLIISIFSIIKYNKDYYEKKYQDQINSLNYKLEQQETKYNDLYRNYNELNRVIDDNN